MSQISIANTRDQLLRQQVQQSITAKRFNYNGRNGRAAFIGHGKSLGFAIGSD